MLEAKQLIKQEEKYKVIKYQLDKKTILHMIRVGNICSKILDQTNLKKKEKENIITSGKIHDTGKAYIKPTILNKTSKLTEEEFEIIKNHIFYSAYEALEQGYNIEIVNNLLFHHENFDGTGYLGLAGEEIPLGARIIRIADAYDALTMDRPYRKKYSKKKALEIIEIEKSYYDPKIFNIFKNLIKRGIIS